MRHGNNIQNKICQKIKYGEFLSILADNFTERLQKDKCNDCKCMECDKFYDTKFNEDLIKRFENTYRFCN